MLDIVLDGVRAYGPILSAVAIAVSSIYTAWALRRQNRSKGWLDIAAYRVCRVSGTPHLYRGDQILAEDNQRGQEIHVWITNTGYRLERIMQIEYHVMGQGWQLGPQPLDTIYFDPYPEPLDVGVAAPHRVFQVPFDVEPQHLRCWEHRVGYRKTERDGETTHDDQRLHQITCAKVVTFKGETLHRHFVDERNSSKVRRCWQEMRCKVGIHR